MTQTNPQKSIEYREKTQAERSETEGEFLPDAGEYQPDKPEVSEPHPQPKKRQREWLLVLGLLLLGLGGTFGWQWWQRSGGGGAGAPGGGAAPAAGKPRGIPVKLAPAEVGNVAETSEFVGTLEAEKAVELQSEVEGRLSQIYVRAGDRVGQGDVIALIDSQEVETQLAQARAARQSAAANLAELQAGPREEEIGQARARLAAAEARQAQLRAGNRSEEIAQARARLDRARSQLQALRSGSSNQEIAQAEAQLEEARAAASLTAERVQRNQQLAAEGAISQDTLDQIVTENRKAQANVEQAQQRLEQLKKSRREDVEQAEAQVEEAEQALALQEKGARPEELASAAAEVEEKRQDLMRLENGTRPEEIERARSQLAEADARVQTYEVQLQNTKIVAPFAGIVGDVPVKLGDFIKKGDKLTTLTQNQALELRLSVPLERASQLRQGLPVEIADSQGQSLGKGQISFISPTVSETSQTVLAKATFDNQEGKLLNNQFVRAKVIWKQRSSNVVVPTTAVIFQGEERFVFVAQGQEPMVAKRQPVKLGIIKGDRAEVVQGLAPGDKIVISGLQKLADGAPLMPLPSGDAK